MIEHYLDSSRIPYFVCVGTSNHLADSVAPKIGDELKKLNISYIGDSTNNVNALTVKEINEEVISKLDKNIYQIIGLDATIGTTDRKLIYKMNPLLPGSGDYKQLPKIGEMQILLNVLYEPSIREWFYSEGDFYNLPKFMNEDYINKLVTEFIEEVKTHYIKACKKNRRIRAIRVGDLALQGNSQRTIGDIMDIGRGTVFNDINCYLKRQINPIYKAVKCLK